MLVLVYHIILVLLTVSEYLTARIEPNFNLFAIYIHTGMLYAVILALNMIYTTE